jgi:hypothetical protein
MLQTRLDQASRKISINEVENTTLSGERDRAMQKLQEACENLGELMDKLDVREKELSSTQKKLDATLQMRGDNDTIRQDFVALKTEYDALVLESKNLRTENGTLRREQQSLQEENESLRSDGNALRREQESLLAENRSLRSSNRTLVAENEELRQSLDSVQQELEVARAEVDNSRNEMQNLEQEKATLREDNDSLVRHNEKYFNENKLLRKENSGFERSVHDLHDENLNLKDEVEFLKQQLDHCRPIGKDRDLSGRFSRDEEDENMTSAFFVPDITIHSNEESGPVEMPTQSQKTIESVELTSQSNKLRATLEVTGHSDRSAVEPENTMQTEQSGEVVESTKQSKRVIMNQTLTAQGQRVAFSIPNKASKSSRTVANQGSKRRVASQTTYRSNSKGGSIPGLDPFEAGPGSTGIVSVDTTQNFSEVLDKQTTNGRAESSLKSKSTKKQANYSSTKDTTSHSQRVAASSKTSRTHTQNKSVTLDITSQSYRSTNEKASCPALSREARRVLDSLCEHSCQNCIVCTRITSHRGAITSSDLANGKKKLKVPRPIPATEQLEAMDESTEEHTMRPSQPPGHALALVIKGLEDEAAHLKMELAKFQARYSSLNSALGRRERKDLASDIKEILKRLEVKNDQIYALYDVLEGQKESGQAMSTEELEFTVFSITGLSTRDVTDQMTWEGIRE